MYLLQFAVIILACAACGHIAERIGQCRVVGEITAGILLGPSLLGSLAPAFHKFLFPAATATGMAHLGELGIVLFMFETGMHLRMPGSGTRSGFGAAGSVAALGLIVPFILGCGAAWWSKPALAPEVSTVPYVLFCGVALAVSAVPVMVRIIRDLGLETNGLARTALAAAMMTDVAGWILLAAVASIAHAEKGAHGVVGSLMAIAAYSLGCLLVTRYVVRPMLARVAANDELHAGFIIVICYVMASAWLTTSLGFHSAFGALLPGMLLRDEPAVRDQWDKQFGPFIRTLLLPVFFSYAGIHTSIASITGYSAWMWFFVFLGVGFIGKFGGSYSAARFCGLAPNEAVFIGSLMNARGLMELIVLSIGLRLGILPARVYTIFVFFALVTTAMTTPLLRYLMRPAKLALADQQR
jgi:Kef-type K+ transport system membrane component KefB